MENNQQILQFAGSNRNTIRIVIKINEVKIKVFSNLKTHLLINYLVKINTNGREFFSYFEIFAVYFEFLNTQFWLVESKLKLISSIRSFKHEGRHQNGGGFSCLKDQGLKNFNQSKLLSLSIG